MPNPCSEWHLGRALNRLGIRTLGLPNGVEPFSHQVTMVIEETAAAIEFDGGIAVSHFEMEGMRAVFEGGRFGTV